MLAAGALSERTDADGRRRCVVIAFTEDWTVLAFDDQLRLLWEHSVHGGHHTTRRRTNNKPPLANSEDASEKLDVEDEQGNSALSVAERVVKNEYMQVKDGETDLDLEDYVGPEMPGEHDPLRTASLAGMRSHAAAPLCRSVRARQEEHAAGEGATQAEERDAARRRVGEAL